MASEPASRPSISRRVFYYRMRRELGAQRTLDVIAGPEMNACEVAKAQRDLEHLELVETHESFRISEANWVTKKTVDMHQAAVEFLGVSDGENPWTPLMLEWAKL